MSVQSLHIARPSSLFPLHSEEKKFSSSFSPLYKISQVSIPRLSVRVRASPPSVCEPTAEEISNLHGVGCTTWTVFMKEPKASLGVGSSRAEVVDYYVETLARVLGNEKEAQSCIYNASWQDRFYFSCEIYEDSVQELARIPGVLSVKPDKNEEIKKEECINSSDNVKFSKLSDMNEYWLVQMKKPSVEIVTKAQMVDYYAKTLTKVLGNEKDAQASIYNISWEKDLGFCCQIDEKCASELADVREVLFVRPDANFGSDKKDYTGGKGSVEISEENQEPSVKTKRLFVTGLSFYTSEKTVRAAFEGFGELVEVKIIMDRISKRSKGYAFIEYTTEEAAASALKEMNGKIINGWMIVVDVAKANPPRSRVLY
ncbi:hypothetical protein LUZ60_000190 [Juncus effusus]|nr:hypothetical protein LUZ60_000190 [Juncus effusus]